jgi:hypothetical protein
LNHFRTPRNPILSNLSKKIGLPGVCLTNFSVEQLHFASCSKPRKNYACWPEASDGAIAILTIVIDYSKIVLVEEIAVSKFKATCLALIEQVRKTRKPIRITRFGKPLAEVVPPSTPERPSAWLGYMAGRGKITGDIISPAAEESEWEVLRD